MQVCFGCQHAFPPTALEYVDVSTELASRLERLRGLVSRLQPATSTGRQAVSEMEEETRALLGVMQKELDDKQLKIRKLEMQLSYVNKENEELRKRQMNASQNVAPPPRAKTSRTSHSPLTTGPTHMLERFIASNSSPRTNGNSAGGAQPGSSTFPPVRMHPGVGRVGPPAAATIKPSDLVSGALYLVLEAVVVRTRAEVGVLWMRPQDSVGELLAPFIAGHSTSNLRASAPYRIPSSSLVGAVAGTGIAVNISPSRHVAATPRHGSAATAESAHAVSGGGDAKQSFARFLEVNRNANLLIPVFSRYGEASRSAIGVIQLIGSTSNPFPFGQRNEADASHAATIISHIVTAFLPTMMVEWSTRIYDHSLITSAATYDSSLDQRAAEKSVDDFDPTPTVIFRSENNERNVPQNLAQTKVLKADMVQNSSPLQGSMDGLREVHRYLKSLEDNWSQAVTTQTVLEKKVEQLTSQLDAARQGLHSITQRDFTGYNRPDLRSSNGAAAAPPRSQPTSPKHTVAATAVDVEDIENDVMQRIKKTSGAVFLTETGELSTPKKRRAEGLSGN